MNINNFLAYFDNLLNTLACFTPNIIKLLLKILFEKIKEAFSVDINTNYFPVFTLFFFNFLNSPRIQEMYGVSPVKFEAVRILNRVLRVRDMFKFRMCVLILNLMTMMSWFHLIKFLKTVIRGLKLLLKMYL